MRRIHLVLAALAVALLPLAAMPDASAWSSSAEMDTYPVASSPFAACSSEPLPQVVLLADNASLEPGLLYLVKGPSAIIAATFPHRIWEEAFEGTLHGVALVSPTQVMAWPPSDLGTTTSPDAPEAPDVAGDFAAWRIVSGWRTPTVMYKPLGESIDVESLGVRGANWQVSAVVLDHLNHFYHNQDRHAWLYLVQGEISEQILGQLEIAEPALISVTVPAQGEVQARTYDSTIWWFQCLPPPSISVVKTAEPTYVFEPGGTVQFDVHVTNTSDLDLTLTTLTDDIYGVVADPGNPSLESTNCALPQPLPISGQYDCSFRALVLGEPGDRQTDTVTAVAQDYLGRMAEATDQATVEIRDIPSSIRVTKTADPDHVPEPGSNVRFTVTVQNTSAIDNVTIHSVIDNRFGNLEGRCDRPLPAMLTIGQSMTCAFVEPIAGQPGYRHTNVVTATGIDDDGVPVSDDDDATVVIDNIPSRIEVVKTANPYWMYHPGGNVTYSFRVSNLSGVDTVIIDRMSDTIYGDLNGQGDCSLPKTLAIGASFSCSFVKLVTGEPDTTHTNVVTVSGVDDDGAAVSDVATATVTITAVPTRVDFLYFTAVAEAGQIVLEWETAWEQDNFGFYLYRGSTSNRDAAKWIHFEPASGSGRFSGRTYRYEDRDIVPGQMYYYWLQDVDSAGSRPGLGPVAAMAPCRVYLPAVTR